MRYMLEVDLESMRMETGLDYGVANEMLWRHYRPLQVGYYDYRCLSRPQQLMTFSSQEFLKEDPKGRSKRALDKSASVMMEAVESGRVDCLVCWMEYELSSGTSGGCGGVGLSTTPQLCPSSIMQSTLQSF
ncbi:hypothetical protein CEUSTIGMA_g8886.t1 [Chlamydomonas eustigma]|uniref:Uncharacterized protein n=1 Tax=Chlamydomonas eustigma TaxID=1157962 RepID=A0A250XEE8_9CHLO|nr:hypothetical protein CEUSTIGMA_g8886.t1 [Chlamydomonas eustigma]|eukprot:GAX81457.1 hypothetical protein CEUSTIGMA_g8886.t1 [Chlamydomonas eustigma]